MAPFNFPSTPEIGDVYDGTSARWTWNGYAWIGGSGATASSPPPPSPPPLPNSERYPFVTRPVPGKNTTPGDPLRGDFICGRISSAALKDPATASLPFGVSRDLANQNLNVASAASGGIFENYDMRGGWTIDFHTAVFGFVIRQCLWDNAKKTSGDPYYACVDAFNNSPQNVSITDNDFVGFKVGTFEESLVAWMSVADKSVSIQRNFMYYPPGDHVKIEAGLVESNFMYGGGTTPEAHFDCIQVQQLNGDLTIRYNHMHGLGDGDSIGATNIVRAVPNNEDEGPKTHKIRCYENVMRGMGYQIENHDGMYLDSWFYTNWQGDWMWGPTTITDVGGEIRYYDNKVLTTGDPISDINPP